MEAVVVFRDPSTRDTVIGSSARLASHVDAAGRPTAGIRLEVPPALRPTYSVLFKYGQTLRARHGPGTRRHIKFDDTDCSLYLNVKLPSDPGWSKVTPEVARRGLKMREQRTNSDLEARLDIVGPLLPPPPSRPRAMSVDAAPTNTTAPARPWTGRRSESVSDA